MNDTDFVRTHFMPTWCLASPEFRDVVAHFTAYDESEFQYLAKPWYEGVYVVLDTHADDFVYVLKGQTKTKHIWRSRSFSEALVYASELNKKPLRAREEMSLTQRIAHMNQQRKFKPVVRRSLFKRCICGTMYRGDEHCEGTG